MNNNTDNQERNFNYLEQTLDAIALLSRIEHHLDSIARSSEGATTSLPKKASDNDDGCRFFSKQTWKSFFPDAAASTISSISAVIFAIGAGFLVFESNYWTERNLAAAKLSVEYAYFSEIGSVEKKPISKLIHQLAQFEQYDEFVIKTMGRHDLRHIDAMADEIGAGDVGKLSELVSMYREFLSEKKNVMAQKIDAVPAMSKSELRMQGRAALENISGLDEDGIRAELVGQFRKNQEEIDRLLLVLDSVRSLLSRVDRRVFVKLSILNTGERAGLVRPRGYIEYLGTCYTMGRVDAPPQDEQPIAVPTYVVNSDTSGVTQTVGKIDGDTMAQYWFEVRKPVKAVTSCEWLPEKLEKKEIASDRKPKTCADGDKATVYLFRNVDLEIVIPDDVECSGPI